MTCFSKIGIYYFSIISFFSTDGHVSCVKKCLIGIKVDVFDGLNEPKIVQYWWVFWEFMAPFGDEV